eukprot:Amastigsp_a843565_216.p4 type:complete len:112 gc:universal Amastigsp_a843565_216:460-795(+)
MSRQRSTTGDGGHCDSMRARRQSICSARMLSPSAVLSALRCATTVTMVRPVARTRSHAVSETWFCGVPSFVTSGPASTRSISNSAARTKTAHPSSSRPPVFLRHGDLGFLM